MGRALLHRDQVQPAMAHAALSAQAIGELAHFIGRALEHQAFQAVVVIQVCMLAGDSQVMMGVLQRHHPLGKGARMVIVDEAQVGHAMRRLALLQARLFDMPAQNVAHGLGPVVVTLVANQRVQFLCEATVQGNGQAFHGVSFSMHRANHARVKRANDMLHRDRAFFAG